MRHLVLTLTLTLILTLTLTPTLTLTLALTLTLTLTSPLTLTVTAHRAPLTLTLALTLTPTPHQVRHLARQRRVRAQPPRGHEGVPQDLRRLHGELHGPRPGLQGLGRGLRRQAVRVRGGQGTK